MSKAASLIRVGIVYVVALVVATAWLAWGPDTRWLWLDGLIADLLATVVVFIASRIHHNSSCYDPYWSVLPPYLVVAWWISADSAVIDKTRAVLLAIVVFVWAIRLTANWVQDWPGMHHEDWRYPMLRDGAGRLEAPVDFLGIHLFPTLIVFLALIPTYAVVVRPGNAVNWLDWVGLIIGLAAPLLQFVADAQMRSFIRTRQPGQAMDQGLWAWSRHPNYFGEISFWFALALFGIAGAPHDWWWLILGAVAMTAMFEGASIPMMEKRSLERRPSYQEIIDRVPRLVPRPPSRS
jgi:steroid 5-alpha reductase family enzyme